jgi:RNA recognition motif-containing protein
MSKKVYVGNLPWKVDDNGLKDIFSQYGDIEEAVVIREKYSRRSKGFGFVTFVNDADADKAISEMDGKEVEGRALKVNEARPMENSAPAEQSAPSEEKTEAQPEENQEASQ